MGGPGATEKAPRAPSSTPPPPAVSREALGDIRSSRPYFLSIPPLTAVARRAASIACLIGLDLIGLTLGIYLALALRDFVYGEESVLWGVLWKAETDWLPFLTLVTVLVFWQAGLYAHRERRAGFGRVFGLLRGSYDILTGDVLKLAGVRRRAILVGEGENLARLHRTLGQGRGGIDYDFVGAVGRSQDGAALQMLGPLDALPAVL